MDTIGIVGSGPEKNIPQLQNYKSDVDLWIGVDRGAWILIDQHTHVHYAIGDYDSVCEEEFEAISAHAERLLTYPTEKDYTDLELAIQKAIELQPKKIYLFGITGGRLDHELINIQLLWQIVKRGIRAILIDQQNILEMTKPDKYTITNDPEFPYISFMPFSEYVKGLTLEGFFYPLRNHKISWGSTLCLSNKLLANHGTFYYEEGILLVIKSRDC